MEVRVGRGHHSSGVRVLGTSYSVTAEDLPGPGGVMSRDHVVCFKCSISESASLSLRMTCPLIRQALWRADPSCREVYTRLGCGLAAGGGAWGRYQPRGAGSWHLFGGGMPLQRPKISRDANSGRGILGRYLTVHYYNIGLYRGSR